MRPPLGVETGEYRIKPPLVKPSRLSSKGSGKDLSQGWAVNFAIGCTHACPFCYVSSIWEKNGRVKGRWGDYLLLPSNLEEAIKETDWGRWAGEEVLMSSTHDPYLPQLTDGARKILEAGLSAGVRFCIQTRSPLASRDIPLIARFREQVRLQISIATLNHEFARIIEPRVPTPEARLKLLQKAADAGLRTGVIIAPVFPPTEQRPDWEADLEAIFERLVEMKPDMVYGECLHIRGNNLELLAEKGVKVDRKTLYPFDGRAGALFNKLLQRYGLNGVWWYEYRRAYNG
jgi:DNA repair photolyase